MFHRDIFVLHGICDSFRFGKYAVNILCNIDLSSFSARTGYARHFINLLFDCLCNCLWIFFHLLKQLSNQAFVHCQQCIQQVFLLDLHIIVFQSNVIGCLNGL